MGGGSQEYMVWKGDHLAGGGGVKRNFFRISLPRNKRLFTNHTDSYSLFSQIITNSNKTQQYQQFIMIKQST